MRTARLIAATALTATALSLAAPTAFAAGGATTPNVTPFAFKIFPTTVKPGGVIGLGVSGCTDSKSASASSGVFDTVNLKSAGTAGDFVGSATVDSDAKPGAQYAVKFTCGSSSGTTTLTVSNTATGTTGTTGTTPTGAVKTGLGGGTTATSPTEVAAGSALAALALGGLGLSAARRRRTVDSH